MSGQGTRERIVTSSAELFRRQGYTGTGMKQIVAEAHAPFGSVYHFFPGGKEQLGAEVVRWSGGMYGLLLPAIFDPAPDVVTAVRTFFTLAGEDLRASGWADACPIATVALEVSSSSEEMREACAERLRRLDRGRRRALPRRRSERGPGARAGDRDDRGARGRLRPGPGAAQHRAARRGRRARRRRGRGRDLRLGRAGFEPAGERAHAPLRRGGRRGRARRAARRPGARRRSAAASRSRGTSAGGPGRPSALRGCAASSRSPGTAAAVSTPSSVPKRVSRSAAPFAPMPFAPGRPSDGSPRSAMRSGTCSGSMP